MRIINSMLDTDLYKITMQQAVLELFSNAQVEYRFTNRGKQKFNKEFLAALKEQINLLVDISLKDDEYAWLKKSCPYFTPQYLEYLKNYRFKPEEVDCSLTADNNLSIAIIGSWHSTILWEVPLMALISELYFKIIDTAWTFADQYTRAGTKGEELAAGRCFIAEFGTRRRRSARTQQNVITALQKECSTFIGTSNVHFAQTNGLKPIGTMAHEWVMGNSVLEGLRNANYYALQNWVRVYNADLGIALTDTYGLDAFLNNFNLRMSMLYDGVRHDSGDPYKFTDRIIDHYIKMDINPQSKTIVFSDGLDVQTAVAIAAYCKGRIKCSFGIGTFLTNNFEGSPSLNMVIKLWSVNGIPVVKLSDSPGKEMGDPNAIKVAKWTFFDEKL